MGPRCTHILHKYTNIPVNFKKNFDNHFACQMIMISAGNGLWRSGMTQEPKIGELHRKIDAFSQHFTDIPGSWPLRT